MYQATNSHGPKGSRHGARPWSEKLPDPEWMEVIQGVEEMAHDELQEASGLAGTLTRGECGCMAIVGHLRGRGRIISGKLSPGDDIECRATNGAAVG